MKKCAQAILEFVLAFAAVTLLTLGIVRIWTWFNANFASQQVAYQAQRFNAASRRPLGLAYPTVEYADRRLSLTEDWVFRGETSGKVAMVMPYGANMPLLDGVGCDQGAVSGARLSMIGSADMMSRRTRIMRKEASHMRDEWKRCECDADEPDTYDGCLRSINMGDRCFWYRIFGIYSEFKRGARELDNAARQTEQQASRMAGSAGEIPDCPDTSPLTSP